MADPGASEQSSAADPASRDPRLGIVGRALWVLLYLLPKNAISRGAGRWASLRLPGWLQRMEIQCFARLVGIDLSEAAEPVEAYPSLQAFFSRRLREGVRPIEGDVDSLTSPCDGRWGAAGPIDGGTLVQAKGRDYRVRDLLGDVDAADVYEGGFFATFYLSPRDYHRLHTPTAGHIRRLAYRPGGLWPVNSIGLWGIDGLFARNERICVYLDPDGFVDPDGAREIVGAADPSPVRSAIAMVAVGATMVGSVKLVFDPMTTNRRHAQAVCRDLGQTAPHFSRGAEWGRFEFGSTIVMLIPPASFEIDIQPLGTSLRLGEVIGRRST